MSDQRPAGVVLTGGASKRMGVDKATLVVDGKPMAVRVADALWEAGCHPVECQGGDADAIGAYGLDVVPDDVPGEGPVVAIHEALLRHLGRDVIVSACDLVDIDAETIRSLMAAGAEGSTEVSVASSGGERHLVSWWRAGTAERLGALLTSGVTAYRDALAEMRAVDVPVQSTAVHNVNTPADVRARG
jgi:molybdopterin-guanine dinucleotide biosynthesis protein A